MIKTELWYIAKKYWQEIPEHFPFVTVLDFIIMPDHIHGLLRIEDRRPQEPVEMPHGAAGCVETHHDASQRPHNTFGPQKNNIPSIIRHFKGAVTRYSKKRSLSFEWQSLYYDQIIRDDNHFYNVQDYIRSNIKKYQDKRLT
jgi:REP element-mobilizing transposase RayT